MPDLSAPKLEPFYEVPGLYDGIVFSPDGATMYATDWQGGKVLAIDMRMRKASTFFAENGIGPADIATDKSALYVPDLMNSRILVFPFSD